MKCDRMLIQANLGQGLMGDHELFFHFVVCNLSKLKVEEKEVTEKHMVSAFLSLTWSWGPVLKGLQWMATKPGLWGRQAHLCLSQSAAP